MIGLLDNFATGKRENLKIYKSAADLATGTIFVQYATASSNVPAKKFSRQRFDENCRVETFTRISQARKAAVTTQLPLPWFVEKQKI